MYMKFCALGAWHAPCRHLLCKTPIFNCSQSKLWSHKFDFTICIFFRLTLDGQRNFYSTQVRRGEHSALIFISPDLMASFNNAQQIHVDATFKVVPQQPPQLKQLMLLSCVAFDNNFVVAFAFMSSKRQDLYEGVLEHIKLACAERAYGLAQPGVVICDYEQALMNATGNVFTEARFQGCYFHYSQVFTISNIYFGQSVLVVQIVELARLFWILNEFKLKIIPIYSNFISA